jgi:hypothetical protein
MVDEAFVFDQQLNTSLCYTRKPESECENCQETPIQNIYTVHFTSTCGKPEYCPSEHRIDLCLELILRWHDVRKSLEDEWMDKYPMYDPMLYSVDPMSSSPAEKDMVDKYHGHCRSEGRDGFIPLSLPTNVTDQLI